MELRVGVLAEPWQAGYVVLNKPAGMISQGPRRSGIELQELIQFWWPGAYLVHRTDYWTSGVIIAGLNSRIRGYFQNCWHEITEKRYLAITRVPNWDAKSVSVPVGGKSARTGFKVLECNREGYALIQCDLVQNGRTHQIRQHLAHLGLPVVGDTRYGGETLSGEYTRDFLLHAWSIAFNSPSPDARRFYRPGDWTSYQAPIPADFQMFTFGWERWDQNCCEPQWYLEVPDWWSRS